MSTKIAPAIAQSAIIAAGKQLRASVDDVAESARQLAISVFHQAYFEVELVRLDSRYSIAISCDKPIACRVCEQWAAAVGAPPIDWRMTYEGRHWEAQWPELQKYSKPLPDIESPES